MLRVQPAPFAILLQLKLTFAGAEVFSRPIVVALAGGALEPNEVWLGHSDSDG